VFGYDPEEIIGESILRLIPPELHYEEEEILCKLRAGERIDHFETTRVRKNGERFPVSVTISPVRDAAGHVIGASKIARDISDRRKNDEIRFRLAAIVDSADDAIVSKDLNGVVRTWNGGAQRMFGYTADEMIGQPILRLMPEELRYEEDEILRKLRAGERIDHYETTRVRKNGESVQVSVTISPIRDESGRVIGASKIARDISDRKRMERLLVQSEKLAATGRMATAIAHEINNPLESLMNLIYLARHYSPPEGEAHELLVTAEGELERVSHLARQTLGYYRDTNSPTELYLHDLIENVMSVYKSKLLASAITAEKQFNDLQKIAVSKGEMLQVISNLVANAIDAMRERGTLSISTRRVISATGDGIQIVVRDNGTGIRREHLERIFEPFFTTKGELGTGIGLWVAKQLLERRGGRISVASSTEIEKSGTTVTVFVPFDVAAVPAHGGESLKAAI
jgi:PAS domain S-box-containing protein